jgi:hypothetical protein
MLVPCVQDPRVGRVVSVAVMVPDRRWPGAAEGRLRVVAGVLHFGGGVGRALRTGKCRPARLPRGDVVLTRSDRANGGRDDLAAESRRGRQQNAVVGHVVLRHALVDLRRRSDHRTG